MSSRVLVFPIDAPIHSIKTDDQRKNYHASLNIRWGKHMSWDVQIGDVVAVAIAANGDAADSEDIVVTRRTIMDWHPEQNKKEWQPALVLGLQEMLSRNGEARFVAHVQWLVMAAQNPAIAKQLKKESVFHPQLQLPYIILSTPQQGEVDLRRIYPTKITMIDKVLLKDKTFHKEARHEEWWFQMYFHCAKAVHGLKTTATKPKAKITLSSQRHDDWQFLSYIDGHRYQTDRTKLPKGLQVGWNEWTDIKDLTAIGDMQLLLACVEGFRKVRWERLRKEFSQIEQEQEHHQQEQQQQQQQQPFRENCHISPKAVSSAMQLIPATLKPSTRKRRDSSSKPASTNKRVRISTAPQVASSASASAAKTSKNAQPSTKSRRASSKPPSKSTGKPSSTKRSKRRSDVVGSTVGSTPTRRMAKQKTASSAHAQQRQHDPSSLSLPQHEELDDHGIQRIEGPDPIKATPIRHSERIREISGRQYFLQIILPVDTSQLSYDANMMSQGGHEWDVKVGQVVAVACIDSILPTTMLPAHNGNPWHPFKQPWSPAQIVGVFCDVHTKEWNLQVRWLNRFADYTSSRQQGVIHKTFGSNASACHVFFDCKRVDMVPILSVLPAHVRVKTDDGSDWSPVISSQSLIPTLHIKCTHRTSGAKKFTCKKIDDWENYHDEANTFPKALQYGLKGVYKDVYSPIFKAAKYNAMVAAAPVELKTRVWASQGITFFDAAEIPIAHVALLKKPFGPNQLSQTIAVGDVVPTMLESSDDSFISRPGAAINPFRCDFDMAQIVAILQGPGDAIRLQVRWIIRFQNLDLQQVMQLQDFQKPFNVFETEHYDTIPIDRVLPGRVILTSCPKEGMDEAKHWKPVKGPESGLPIIPMLCKHMLWDDEVEDVQDWNLFDVSMKAFPAPLVRGLTSKPPNRTNKEWVDMLFRAYRMSMAKRHVPIDASVFGIWAGEASAENDKFATLHAELVTVSCGPCLGSCKTTHGAEELLESASASIVVKRYASLPKGPKAAHGKAWTFKLGDLVCYANGDAAITKPFGNAANSVNPWHPFYTKWSYAQVVAIRKQGEAGITVDLRCFFRPSELPDSVATCAPPTLHDGKRTVFESNELRLGLPAAFILGPALLFLGCHKVSRSLLRQNSSLLPAMTCRSQYFFHLATNQFQPIQHLEISPASWHQYCQQRGLFAWASQEGLFSSAKAIIATYLQHQTTTESKNPTIFSQSDAPIRASISLEDDASGSQGKRLRMLTPEAKLALLASSAHDEQLAVNNIPWDAHVGDYVAFENGETGFDAEFPFTVKWKCGRIVDMSARNQNSSKTEALNSSPIVVAVRPLVATPYNRGDGFILELEEDPKASIVELSPQDILAPLSMISPGVRMRSMWQQGIPRLPVILCTRPPQAAADDSQLPAATQRTSPSSDDVKDTKARSTDKHHALLASAPTHEDASSRQVFHDSFLITPPYDSYSDDVHPQQPPTNRWEVRRGDIVSVMLGPQHKKRYPMQVGWGVVQILAIWMLHDDFHSAEPSIQGDHKSAIDCVALPKSKVHVEIRWFWDSSDIAGSSSRRNTVDPSNELFETDHVDVITAESILSPAKLYADSNSIVHMDSQQGMPVPQFQCQRFWSVTKQSLVPTGGLEGLVQRGNLHSKFSHVNASRHQQQQRQLPGADGRSASTWQQSFASVIRKLTLKDASTAAYEKSETLVGRESELHRLHTFLTAAIRGDRANGDVKSSILLAGPPGVGKTACVRSVMESLNTEQRQGRLPAFRFIKLNGMEMNDPREAYVRLWNALEGNGALQSPDVACRNLEAYFTRKGKPAPNELVSVVLLDEIDYLVTDQQTVLYNFFDWPQRVAEQESGRRLVVIGISNTLNLAERLMGRVRSRVGKEKLSFLAYDVAEIVKILNSKVEQANPTHPVLHKDAITFAAKKTAALCGDIRKAFLLCRSAAEAVKADFIQNAKDDPNASPIVRVPDIQKASTRSFFNASQIEPISTSSAYEALLLVSIAALRKHTGREVGNFDIQEVMAKMSAVASSSGYPLFAQIPTFDQTLRLLEQLHQRTLVQLATARSTSSSFRASRGGSGGAWPLITLPVESSTLLRGLRDTPYAAFARKFLS